MLSKFAEIIGLRSRSHELHVDSILKKDIYSYEIQNRKGNIEKGEIQAPSLKQAIRQLEKKSLSIVSVKKAAPELPVYMKRVNHSDLMVFFRQLSCMWSSGLSVQRSLNILADQSTDYHVKSIMISLNTMLQQGESFTDALSHFPEIFSKFHIFMLRASEEGGFIDRSIDYLAEVMEREERLHRKVQAALIYPVIVFVVGVVGCLGVFYWIYPFLQSLVNDMGVKIPFYAKGMMFLAEALRKYYVVIPTVLLILFIFSRLKHFVKRTVYGRVWYERIILSIPVVKELVTKAVITHMLIVLSSLLRAAVPVARALDLTAEASDNFIIGGCFGEISQRIKEGSTLTESMSGFDILPRSLTAMISVGEETGELSEVLMKIASLYEVELNASLEAFTKLIEPLATGLLGIIVGIMLLSFFVPIYLAINAI